MRKLAGVFAFAGLALSGPQQTHRHDKWRRTRGARSSA
ncbi:hypothetical protein CFter6_0079 [Collimonas fungivorans]|uniref:Uncharacterized protein n=1 Tax=Collimonas fungivorans TaxID=158899 RepID=A0A127P4N4_9BURK|nr:hypothetical protein CFter6_0079 [Collimonas fungivorans]